VIVFAEEALADLERILEFNFERDPASALEHIEKVRSAVLVLEDHPEIGRPVQGSTLRELVISYGNTGYIALYEFSPAENLVRVAAIRHQREAGYRQGPDSG
jgi:plasmid stabilization system protein ParE